MDHREVTALLAFMAARDGRQVGAVEVQAWHDDVARWDFATAREAVHRHYTRSREFMRPYDLIQAIREIRAERLKAAGAIVPPPELADDPCAEMAWIRSRREAIASGLTPPPAPQPRALLAEPEDVAQMRRELEARWRVPPRDGEREAGVERPASTVDPATAEAAEAERRRQLDALAGMAEAQVATS